MSYPGSTSTPELSQLNQDFPPQGTQIGVKGKQLAYDPRASMCSPNKRPEVTSPLRESLLQRTPRDSFDQALVSGSPGDLLSNNKDIHYF